MRPIGRRDAGPEVAAPPLRLVLAAEVNDATQCGSLDFSPEGSLITLCGADEVRAYEPGTWRQRSTLRWERRWDWSKPVNFGLLAAGSNGLIVVGFRGKIVEEAVVIRNLDRPKRPPRILTHRIADGPISAFDLCVGGGDRVLVVAGQPGDRARVYDPVRLGKLGAIGDEAAAVACDPLGEFVVTARRGALVWSVAEHRVVRRLPAFDGTLIVKVAIVGAMERIVAGNTDGWLLAWDAKAPGKPEVLHRGQKSSIWGCPISELQARAQGDWLLSVGFCSGLMLSDLRGRSSPIKVARRGWTRPRHARFSPDGNWLAVMFEGGPLRLFKVEPTPR